MLSDPYYKQKEGHEVVLSELVSLMLGTVLFIWVGVSVWLSQTMLLKLFSLKTWGGGAYGDTDKKDTQVFI